MDIYSKNKRSLLMSAVRSKRNASTELRLLSMFRAAQITGWRREYEVYGRPDIVFPEARLAVFVDGCFWHGCPKHYRLPKTNKVFWLRKITRNKERDREVAKELRKRGWRFVRLWECAIRTEPRKSLSRVARALGTLEKCGGSLRESASIEFDKHRDEGSPC
jgi:DNA mismatch endonuclease (patch repair protein)